MKIVIKPKLNNMTLSYLKRLSYILFLICSLNAFSQVELKSKIVDFTTYEPLENASIYIDKSTIGSVSNVDGKFVL